MFSSPTFQNRLVLDMDCTSDAVYYIQTGSRRCTTLEIDLQVFGLLFSGDSFDFISGRQNMDDVKINENAKRMRFRRAAACIVFLIFLGFVFTRITYIVRPVNESRQHLVGLNCGDVDMIYIGGSAAHRFWQPLKAWNDFGLTSYLYTQASISAESIQYFIQEAQKMQDTKLYVIDARSLQYWVKQGDSRLHLVRLGLDGLDVFSSSRWQLIDKIFSTRDPSEMDDRVTFDWDIIKYHTATENLASPDAWKLVNNSAKHFNKGFEWAPRFEYLDAPVDYTTDDRAELDPTCQAILVDLLEYCKREKLNVLFVVCPYVINEEHQKIYNTVGDIVASYGFDFLNTNSEFYYDEIGVDFSMDFYDNDHMNPLGANKYTAFLEKYITDHYNLPNHTGDPTYSSWDEDYEHFAEEELAQKGEVLDLISRAKEGMVVADLIASADNILEWNMWALRDDRFTILFAKNGEIDTLEIAEQRAFEQWDLSLKSSGDIRVISDESVIFTNVDSKKTSYSSKVGIDRAQGIKYEISNEEGEISIVVDGVEYTSNQEGVSVVVINNDYRKVVDVLTVTCEDGHLVFKR